VKEHIISYAQRAYRYGKYIVGSLQNLKKLDLKQQRPTKQVTTAKDMDTRKLEQDGFHIMYQAEIKQYLERVQALEESLNRAYALIIGTKTIAAKPFRDG